MTKEEYSRYLESDYWKGFSFSIIKERNFTCADCGRQFPNERNMLQVHHLVYRDVAPWSYKPEELVVLCRECHAKRHGIVTDSAPKNNPVSSGSFSNKDEGHYSKTYTPGWGYSQSENANREPSKSSDKWDELFPKAVAGIICLIIVLAVAIVYVNSHEASDSVQEPMEATSVTDAGIAPKAKGNIALPRTPSPVSTGTKSRDAESSKRSKVVTDPEDADEEIQDKMIQDFWENQAEKEGVSTEGSVEDIQERLNRKFWVDRAKQEGVSTAGSVEDIQDRLDRKFWVDRAKAEGVSTEGSVSDIQDRLDRKFWVDRAKQEGVSTEGSVSDIQDRLDRKFWVDRAKAEGVSTEGSVSDIQDRLNRKFWEEQAKKNL